MGGGHQDWLLVVSRDPSLSLHHSFPLRAISLKNHGADDLVDRMFDLGSETMALPLSEKMKFEQGDDGMSFG